MCQMWGFEAGSRRQDTNSESEGITELKAKQELRIPTSQVHQRRCITRILDLGL